MKKINRKRLNNKGFTLIELLAVVVILAVVMGIAMNSVLTSMNKSRGGSLADTAMIIANAFNQKYTESLVGGVPSNVYGDVLTNGYNFQSDATYYLDAGLANTFNITAKNYAFANDTTSNDDKVIFNSSDAVDAATTDAVNGKIKEATVKNSFVNFNVSTGRFVVCMFANKKGSYFVDNYKEDAATAIGSTGVTGEVGSMYACSDGVKSWTD